MIILNNKKFAETEDEFINSLFKVGGTCVGYAKRLKRQIKLFNHKKTQVGVINQHGVLGSATPQKDGKTWYSYMDIKIIGEYKSYAQEKDKIESLSINKDSKGYFFK